MKILARSLLLSLLVFVFVTLNSESLYARLQVFASFENPAEVAAVTASKGVRISVSKRFAAWGGNSLEVIFPAGGGWAEISKVPADWRLQESLLVFIWSEQPAKVELELRDSAGGRFTKTFPLRRGANHLQLRLADAQGIDMLHMRSLVVKAFGSGTCYLDYFALDRFHPVLEKRGRWDINYSLQVETPHVPWARPFVRGPIKTYAISDVADGRGIVELAQRLELDFKATSIGRSPSTNKWGFGDFYEQRSSGGESWSDAYSLAQTYIADDLLNGPNYDVILWPGLHPWESYPREVRDQVRKRVEAGAGLVLFYPFSRAGTDGDLWALSALTQTQNIKQNKDGAELDKTQWRPNKNHYITRGIPLDAFPWGHIGVAHFQPAGEVLLETARGTPVLAVRTLGKGRVVSFAYIEKGMIPEIDNVFETGLHYPYQEYLWSLVARAVVWAAKKEPQAAIQAVQQLTNNVTVRLKDPPRGALVSARISNNFGEIEGEMSREYSGDRNASEQPWPHRHKAGGGREFWMDAALVNNLRSAGTSPAEAVTLKFPKPLGGGRHFLHVRLLESGRVHDWATTTFDTPSKVTIHSIALESNRVIVGEPVSARLRLSASGKADCTVTARLFDNYDRLVDEQGVRLTIQGESEQAFNFNSKGVLTHLAKVDCEVNVAGLRSDRRIAEVFVLQPRKWDDYDIVMYRFGPDPMPGIWPTIDQQLRRLNVTTLSSYSLNHSKHANYNIQAQTRLSGQESPDGPKRAYYNNMKKKYAETRDKKVLVREYCLNNPAYRELISKELQQKTEPWVPFSPLSYYVYEEPSLTCYEDDLDICFSSYCMAGMRNWLKEEYRTVEALNGQWGTRFTAWDQVVPDDTYEAQARGNYASWADHRTFMEKTYAECFEFVLDLLRKIDPAGILLNSGTQESGAHNGCDYSRINRFTRHLNAYSGGNQLDFHRCFNPDLKISGGAGYGVLGKDVFYNFYDNLFKGCNGGAYIFWQYSTLDPDLTLSQSGKDMEEGFRELRGEGIGKLVGMATPDNHGIAIHYSYPSIHGTWIVDGQITERVSHHTSPTFRRFNANRDGWVKILRDAGLQFDFIAYSDVEKGGLISKGYKTLILPMSVALSDKEVEAIRAFARQGGIVIADALPGIMDEHCSFRPHRALADVFGIAATRLNREGIVAMNGEPNLKLEVAEPYLREEGRPILLHNRFGLGNAYLLNYFLDRYPEDRLERRNRPVLEKIERILTAAKIKPKVQLNTLAGDPVAGCASYLFNNGSTRLLGLVPDKEKLVAQKVRISLDEGAAIYDVRQKRYLGSGSIFETEIEPAVPRLFALVKGQIAGLDAKAPSTSRLGEEVRIDFRIHGAGNLRSVAKVVVTDPTGRQIGFYGGNENITDGAGSASFSTALNDPSGIWHVSVTEVISGETSQAEINIVPRR
ncbi:MAG TPA: beta-galactosidase [Acidobacteriota bacterium]|nr:beta-galactosidase [Acidobacteriota bacterium]